MKMFFFWATFKVVIYTILGIFVVQKNSDEQKKVDLPFLFENLDFFGGSNYNGAQARFYY